MSTSGRARLGDAERANPVLPIHLWRTPAGAQSEVLIVTHVAVYEQVHRHAVSALPNETGGFLLGKVGFDARAACWVVEVDEATPVEPLTQTPVHFTFSWRDVDRVRGLREERGKALLGWYHTHPDVGVFLSDTDLEKTHRVLFSEPFQVALVYDPVRGRAGYFCWEGAQVIDAGAALWREFEIAEVPEPTPMPAPSRIEQSVEPDATLAALPVGPVSPPGERADPLVVSFQDAAAGGAPSVPVRGPGAPAIAAPAATVAAPSPPRASSGPRGARMHPTGQATVNGRAFVVGIFAGLVLVAIGVGLYWWLGRVS